MKVHRSINILLLAFLVLALTPVKPVNAQASPNGVVTCDATTKTGQKNTPVRYTCTLTNNGEAAGDFSIKAASNPDWTAFPPSTSFTGVSATPPDNTRTFPIDVYISPDAIQGSFATTTLTVEPSSDPTVTLTTQFIPPDPTETLPPPVATRPMLSMEGYSPSNGINPGKDFELKVTFKNTGAAAASNIIVTFSSESLMPLDTGGVRTLGGINPGAKAEVSQRFQVSRDLANVGYTSMSVTVSYTDATGEPFTSTYSLTFGIGSSVYNGPAQPTSPGTVVPRPQMVINTYRADVDPLQPGAIFNLELNISNLGNSEAKAVTMVLGGSASSVDMTSGTPQPGGIQGAGSDTTNFAPLGSSNLFYLGDIAAGANIQGKAQLIVNVNTQPGAYPLKVSFVYNDNKNNRIVDDQVITLLVYSMPQIEISFYREPGVLFTNMPNMLPLQITNLGRKTALLGNMKVSVENAELNNATMLVGALDPGGYYTLDTEFTPPAAGEYEVLVTVNYTDDFNQPRTFEQTLIVSVEEGEMMGPGMGMEGVPGYEGMPVDGMPMDPGMFTEPQEETLWQKVVRFFKGLFGLGSEQTQPEQEFPMDGMQEMPGDFMPKGGGGGG